jgi:hypothetical protein
MRAGIMYAVIATSIALLFVRRLSQTPLRRLHVCLLSAFAIPVSLALAFPVSLNSDNQYFVNKQTEDRNARRELTKLFATDPAFRDIRVTTSYLKLLDVGIHSSVPTKPDLERLRTRLAAECDFVQACYVHLHIYVLDESRTYTENVEKGLANTSM